jgi:hypothetical protein
MSTKYVYRVSGASRSAQRAESHFLDLTFSRDLNLYSCNINTLLAPWSTRRISVQPTWPESLAMMDLMVVSVFDVRG